jgi:putative transcriptional regulator
MATESKFKSSTLAAVHSSASSLHKEGVIDKTTMHDFDIACLAVPATIEPAQIQRIRESSKVSQPVFARYLNVSESTVQKWETGAKRPSGMALKLLSLVQKHGIAILDCLPLAHVQMSLRWFASTIMPGQDNCRSPVVLKIAPNASPN